MLNATNISIKNKLIIIQLCTAIVSIILCGIFFVISYYKLFNNYKVESLESIAVVVGDNVTPALEFGDAYKDDANESLGKLQKHSHIVNATIFDAQGKIFAQHIRGKDNNFSFNLAALPKIDKLGSLKDNDFLNIYYKLHHQDEFLGTLCLRAEMQSGIILKQYLTISCIVLVLGFLIAFLLSTLLQKSISKPILRLVNSMKEVSQKQDYSIRTNQRGSDEIAQLSEGFDDMLEQIQKRDKSLQEAHGALEERVEERTKELQHKTKELEISNKELEQFAYVASHDLQEPLRMIGSFSQLIARRYSNIVDEEMNEYIHYIVDGVERMQKLIKDLLLLSRVGTQSMNIKESDASLILYRSLSNLKYVIQENGAEITYDNLPTLQVDDLKLTQLFQNLISNAIKFRADVPPKIHISVEESDKAWKFSVKDNGIGIEKEYANKIFMIFQRLNRNKYPGTGIGLAICKKIVDLHGGEITFESEVNEGTTFYFSIPKDQEAVGNKVVPKTSTTVV